MIFHVRKYNVCSLKASFEHNWTYWKYQIIIIEHCFTDENRLYINDIKLRSNHNYIFHEWITCFVDSVFETQPVGKFCKRLKFRKGHYWILTVQEVTESNPLSPNLIMPINGFLLPRFLRQMLSSLQLSRLSSIVFAHSIHISHWYRCQTFRFATTEIAHLSAGGVGGTHQIALFALCTLSTLVSFYRALANQLGNRNMLPSSNLNEALERSEHRFVVVNFIFSGFYLIVLCVRCSQCVRVSEQQVSSLSQQWE